LDLDGCVAPGRDADRAVDWVQHLEVRGVAAGEGVLGDIEGFGVGVGDSDALRLRGLTHDFAKN